MIKIKFGKYKKKMYNELSNNYKLYLLENQQPFLAKKHPKVLEMLKEEESTLLKLK